MTLIVSLTSIPPRFPGIGPTLAALLAQRARIDEIRLIIPHRYRRFPDYAGELPEVPEGITIHRPEEDLGPASKLLFTAREFRGRDDVQILICDDDRLYEPDWAGTLSAIQLQRPDEAVALSGWEIERLDLPPPSQRPQPRRQLRNRRWDFDYRWKRIRQQIALRTLRPTRRKPPRRLVSSAGYADIFDGFGGVVLRPDFFDDRAFDIPPVVWGNDDVWLSGLLAHRGIRIWVPAGLYSPRTTDADDAAALWRSKIEGADPREVAVRGVTFLRENFGVWR